MLHIKIIDSDNDEIQISKAEKFISSSKFGASIYFLGTVRNQNENKSVSGSNGFPTSKVIHLASTSCFSLILSAIRLIIYDLCQGGVFFHTSNPFFADCNAFSISSEVALEACPIISSVAGLITS